MNTKIESYIQDKTETLEKVLTFHLLNSIKKYYGTVDNLKKADNKIKSDKKNHTVSNKELSHFNNCFYVSPDKISKIVGIPRDENGKKIRVTTQVLDNLIKRNNIKILPNYTIRFKSGKTFVVKTRYILDYEYIDKVWDNKEVWNNESSYYTKKEHKLIDKFILNYNKPTKTVKVSNTETQETTKDDLEMKNELNLSIETSDDEWFEIFSYEETETDLKDISELIIFKTNTDFYSNFHYNSSNETEDLNFVDYKLKKVLDTIPTKEEIENYFGRHSFDDIPYGYIYMVKNKKSGRCYIGQTTSGISIFNGGALKRYSQGWLKEHNHKYNVQEDLNLYGAYSFSDLKIISLAYSKDELDMLEAYWMKKTNSLIDGYNIALPHFINIKSKK